jgi:hypothetical protein
MASPIGTGLRAALFSSLYHIRPRDAPVYVARLLGFRLRISDQRGQEDQQEKYVGLGQLRNLGAGGLRERARGHGV